MKMLVTLATLAFWSVVAGVDLMAAGSAPASPPAGPSSSPQSAPPAAAPAGTAPPQDRAARYTLAELARHADARSCWMAIDGVVYDFTAYLPRHPAPPQAMLRHCGKQASEAFRTKDAGRPHSPYARKLLDEYRIGTLLER